MSAPLANSPTVAPARLWLIRHGQTDWNAAGRIQGQSPTELNAEGRREARDLSVILARTPRRFAACYASDLPRATQTAEILAAPHRLIVTPESALRERTFGPLEGAWPTEIRAARAQASLGHSGDLADWTGMPGVESNDSLWQRSSAALRAISQRHADQDVLVVTHGGVIARILYRTLEIPDGTPRYFPLSNGIVVIIECHPAHFALVTLADMLLLAGDRRSPDTAMMPPPA